MERASTHLCSAHSALLSCINVSWANIRPLLTAQLETAHGERRSSAISDLNTWDDFTTAKGRSVIPPTQVLSASLAASCSSSRLSAGREAPRSGMGPAAGPTESSLLQLLLGGVKEKPGIARSLVVPATPTPEHWLRLSNLDRVVNPTFTSAILFFTNLVSNKDSDREFSEVVESLKDSLSRTLVDFYPLAGRLEVREDGLVDLHCNDQGAVFVEVALDASLADVGGVRPMPALSGLEVAKLGPGPQYIPDQLTPMPTLVIQVTQFRKCGSVALAVNWHHTVADGSAGCHFMQSWAEVATGKELTVVPQHNRDLLRPRKTLNSSLVPNGYSTKSVDELLPKGGAAEVTTEPTLLKSFLLTKKAAQGLKAVAGTEDCEYTSAEAISGYLWQLMTKARQEILNGDGDHGSRGQQQQQSTRFFMFVDGRKKLALPAGYFGNVVCSACAVSTEEEIVRRPLNYATDLIRKSMTTITGEYFRSLIDWVEEQRLAPPKSEHVNSLGHDVAATFWTFFPLYDMDFGWGKPSFATRNAGPRPLIDGIAMMPSPEGRGNMVALINLHADRMARLQTDSAFSSVYS